MIRKILQREGRFLLQELGAPNIRTLFYWIAFWTYFVSGTGIMLGGLVALYVFLGLAAMCGWALSRHTCFIHGRCAARRSISAMTTALVRRQQTDAAAIWQEGAAAAGERKLRSAGRTQLSRIDPAKENMATARCRRAALCARCKTRRSPNSPAFPCDREGKAPQTPSADQPTECPSHASPGRYQ
jgi:hypothetical protein